MDTSCFQTNAFRLFIEYTKQSVIDYLSDMKGVRRCIDPYVEKTLKLLDIIKPKAIRYYELLREYDLGSGEGVIVCLLRHDFTILIEAFHEINLIKHSIYLGHT